LSRKSSCYQAQTWTNST